LTLRFESDSDESQSLVFFRTFQGITSSPTAVLMQISEFKRRKTSLKDEEQENQPQE
jgi:hypothetical protein